MIGGRFNGFGLVGDGSGLTSTFASTRTGFALTRAGDCDFSDSIRFAVACFTFLESTSSFFTTFGSIFTMLGLSLSQRAGFLAGDPVGNFGDSGSTETLLLTDGVGDFAGEAVGNFGDSGVTIFCSGT